MIGSPDILQLLKGVDLFSALNEEELEQIASVTVKQKFCRDETIILEKDVSFQALYIIASGEVQVYLSGVDGRETILSLMGRGDFFGEISLIDGEPRSASVRTVSDAELLIILREDFLALLEKQPGIARGLLIEMALRLRRANHQIGSLSTMSVYGRVARTIFSLVEERGVRVRADNGQLMTVIRNRPTQQQLADMSGTTRETVSRVCSSLIKKGAISMNSKEIVVFEDSLLQETEG